MARRPTVFGPTKQATRGMCTPIYLQCGHIGPWNNIETPKNTKQCIPLENADSRLVICLHSKHIYMILHALPRWSTWFYMILHEISIIPVSRISQDAFSSNGDLGRGLDPRCVSASPWVSGWRGSSTWLTWNWALQRSWPRYGLFRGRNAGFKHLRKHHRIIEPRF